jgi:hypothetical protein
MTDLQFPLQPAGDLRSGWVAKTSQRVAKTSQRVAKNKLSFSLTCGVLMA